MTDALRKALSKKDLFFCVCVCGCSVIVARYLLFFLIKGHLHLSIQTAKSKLNNFCHIPVNPNNAALMKIKRP